jgi:hypothetical protein
MEAKRVLQLQAQVQTAPMMKNMLKALILLSIPPPPEGRGARRGKSQAIGVTSFIGERSPS